jgi:hypothetical protein
MLRMSENEFERRLLWRRVIQQSAINPAAITPTGIAPKKPASTMPVSTTIAPPLPMPPITTPQPVETGLETRLEQAAPIKQQLDAARSWRGFRAWGRWKKPDFRRAYSAGRLLFQVIGVAGYAGYFVSMHTLMRVFSGALMAGAWFAIYRIKGSGQP